MQPLQDWHSRDISSGDSVNKAFQAGAIVGPIKVICVIGLPYGVREMKALKAEMA